MPVMQHKVELVRVLQLQGLAKTPLPIPPYSPDRPMFILNRFSFRMSRTDSIIEFLSEARKSYFYGGQYPTWFAALNLLRTRISNPSNTEELHPTNCLKKDDFPA